MNQLQGTISEVTTKDHLSVVKVDIQEIRLSAIVIDTPETAPHLKVGNEIFVLFKETEVIIGMETTGLISLQNKIPGTIVDLNKGVLLSRVIIESKVGIIISIITTNAVEQLSLKKGTGVVALIKTNEMMLSSS